METRRGLRGLVAGVAVVLVLGAGIAGAVNLRGDGDSRSSSASAASLSAEALAAAASTTVPPTTVTTQVTTTVARPPATTATTKAPAGPAITVEVLPARPRAGETVRFVVTASQPGNCCSIGLQPGDGGTAAPATQSCTAGPGGTQRVEFTHVYNRPSTWTAVARADAGRACDMTDAMRAAFPGGQPSGATIPPVTTPALPQISASHSVTVAGGAITSQGPAAPTVEVTLAAGAGGEATLDGAVADPDGWVSRVEVDWGDGTPATVVSQGVTCRTGDGGWPVGSPILLKSLPAGAAIGWTATAPRHAYATAGTYTVKVTGFSSGCDGGAPQQATRTLTWTRTA